MDLDNLSPEAQALSVIFELARQRSQAEQIPVGDAMFRMIYEHFEHVLADNRQLQADKELDAQAREQLRQRVAELEHTLRLVAATAQRRSWPVDRWDLEQDREEICRLVAQLNLAPGPPPAVS